MRTIKKIGGFIADLFAIVFGAFIFAVMMITLMITLGTIWFFLTIASIFVRRLRGGRINTIMNEITEKFTFGVIPAPHRNFLSE